MVSIYNFHPIYHYDKHTYNNNYFTDMGIILADIYKNYLFLTITLKNPDIISYLELN